MMVRRFVHIFPPVCMALALTAVSCYDGSYYGLSDNDQRNFTLGINGEPELVTVIVGDYGRYTDVTKGEGPVLDRWSWMQSGAQFNVYAFRKDSACYTSKASRHSGACLIDGSLDTPGVLSGRSATFMDPEFVVKWTKSDDTLHYPAGKVPYDFFAYSTGGIEIPETDIDRQPGHISFPLKIDGSTDIMYAKAELTESQIEMFPYLDLSDEEQKTFGNICYSDYSASKGIVPVLNFRHALTRICFDLYPGEKGSDKVLVQRVTVTTRDSCIFTVASSDSTVRRMGADFSIDEKDALIDLAEENGTPLNDTLYHTTYSGDYTEDVFLRPHIRIGGCFLLPEEEEYSFEFYTRVVENDYNQKTVIKIKPKKTSVFLAGSVYVIRIAIYDLTPVVFDAGYDPWNNEITE